MIWLETFFTNYNNNYIAMKFIYIDRYLHVCIYIYIYLYIYIYMYDICVCDESVPPTKKYVESLSQLGRLYLTIPLVKSGIGLVFGWIWGLIPSLTPPNAANIMLLPLGEWYTRVVVFSILNQATFDWLCRFTIPINGKTKWCLAPEWKKHLQKGWLDDSIWSNDAVGFSSLR